MLAASKSRRRGLSLAPPPALRLGCLVLVLVLLAWGTGRARGQACDTAALAEKAQAVIRGNFDAAHGWTVPSPGVAPFLVRGGV